MKPEEYEIEEDTAQEIVKHFKMPIPPAEIAHKLARYRELATEIEALEASKDILRKELLELGKGQESLSAGGYVAFFKKVSGRVTTDWKRAYKDAVGEMPESEVSKYITKGEDTIRMEVKRIN